MQCNHNPKYTKEKLKVILNYFRDLYSSKEKCQRIKMSHGTVKNSKNAKNGNGHHAPATTNYESQTLSPLPPAPDGGWGWAVIFASFMVHVM
ncbi:putative monocarboxylate transporter, partial [Operophtera brumata]